MFISKRRTLCVIGTLVIFYIWLMGMFWFGYSNSNHRTLKSPKQHDLQKHTSPPSNPFRPQNGDVLVVFHMQKTGGTTFNTHLVKMDIKPPCLCTKEAEGGCRCKDAYGYMWLFSRFTTSSSCGVHPPLEELRSCVPKFLAAAEGHDENTRKRYLYTTVLREPVQRSLSEWRHLQTVPPWPTSCVGQSNPVEDCVKAAGSQISLDDFIRCRGNPANNRMTRMLTSDSAHLCDDLAQDNEETLARAKRELESLSFFGLTERQEETKKLFESTFGVKILSSSEQEDTTAELLRKTSPDLLNLIKENNKLDIELYKFASKLFLNRLSRGNV